MINEKICYTFRNFVALNFKFQYIFNIYTSMNFNIYIYTHTHTHTHTHLKQNKGNCSINITQCKTFIEF